MVTNVIKLVVAILLLLAGLISAWGMLPMQPAQAASSNHLLLNGEYEDRKALLPGRVAQPFIDDPLRNVETTLDTYPFTEINALDCPKPIDNSEGWSVEMRAGGRPFFNFDDVQLNGAPWVFEPCTPGTSAITQPVLDAHYAAGKRVNRLWFTHKASNGYPIVVVMTPDGFFNAGGATSPLGQGAAARMGFIGEPFGENDYLQHVDEINIVEINEESILVIYNIQSEAGEGVLEVELRWNAAEEKPELHFRSAHMSRLNTRIGFAGLNFMRGPTLYGLLSEFGTPESGIEAFHDGRTVFLVEPTGLVTPNLLVPPVLTTTVVQEEISTNTAIGARLVMDQPQNVENYFSKHPEVAYERRTDLILKLTGSSGGPVTVQRAQQAVDLSAANPEANETVNVFYAIDMVTNQLYEFSYTLSLAAEDFENLYWTRPRGVVYISDQSEAWNKLYFLPLDAHFLPAGPARPLTDGVIADPHRPSISADRRFVIFDADDYKVSSNQRIYILDLARATVRRITVDPFGASEDWGASFNRAGSRFAMITSRQGSPSHLNIEEVDTGLGSGFGNSVVLASSADWSHLGNEIAFANTAGLWLLDVESGNTTQIISGADIQNPSFSSCSGSQSQKIAYATTTDTVYIVNRDGTDIEQVAAGAHPTWAGENHLIVHRTVDGNTDLYLVNLDTGENTRLTTNPGIDIEPAWIGGNYCTYIPAIQKNVAQP